MKRNKIFPKNLREFDANKNKRQSQPSVSYQLAEIEGGSIDNAFDILFEETLRQGNGLTTNYN